jgi:hypothetical protein
MTTRSARWWRKRPPPEPMGPRITARRIGREGEPVVLVEDFAPDPGVLRRAALDGRFEPAGEHYPGVRAALPSGYFDGVRDTLALVFSEAFGATGGARVIDARFSIVTAMPDTLTPAQRLPHVDAIEPGRVAMVQYLGADDLGGTAFYRHRSTGFETIDAARAPGYFAVLSGETARHPPQGYIAGDTPLFERIESVPARFNRAIFYRSRLLHSGQIAPIATLSADPAKGRLTVTAFFELR